MVLALILNYNGLAMTRDCCAALARQTAVSELRVLVVENGSKANTAEELAAACPNAEVVHTPVNLGFSGGIAFGLAHGKAAQLPFDWLWLLNNDTIPSSTALAALLATGASLPSVGAVGCPLSAAPDRGSPQHASMRMRPPFYVPHPGLPPDYLCGASLLISRRAFEKLGPPDVAFPFFFEDADWGFRARAAGSRSPRRQPRNPGEQPAPEGPGTAQQHRVDAGQRSRPELPGGRPEVRFLPEVQLRLNRKTQRSREAIHGFFFSADVQVPRPVMVQPAADDHRRRTAQVDPRDGVERFHIGMGHGQENAVDQVHEERQDKERRQQYRSVLPQPVQPMSSFSLMSSLSEAIRARSPSLRQPGTASEAMRQFSSTMSRLFMPESTQVTPG